MREGGREGGREGKGGKMGGRKEQRNKESYLEVQRYPFMLMTYYCTNLLLIVPPSMGFR